ncbi:hypothetical protein ACH5RR_029129 [Cinchona calisaya]|uniref:Uncharacterized protein n=1 Tax=Cinchona calisaya TaxID=153742 RepID=A0ABD2YQU6_9GENT
MQHTMPFMKPTSELISLPVDNMPAVEPRGEHISPLISNPMVFVPIRTSRKNHVFKVMSMLPKPWSGSLLSPLPELQFKKMSDDELVFPAYNKFYDTFMDDPHSHFRRGKRNIAIKEKDVIDSLLDSNDVDRIDCPRSITMAIFQDFNEFINNCVRAKSAFMDKLERGTV